MALATRPRPDNSLINPGFPLTQLSLINAAGQGDGSALSMFYELYWYPLYVFARRSGSSSEEAQDLLQAFFLRAIEKLDFAPSQGGGGRFRSWLLASFKNFMSNQRDAAMALKRGGGHEILSIDARDAEGRYLCEPPDERTPEQHYHRSWALALLARTLERLRADYAQKGKATLFDGLKDLLTTRRGDTPLAELALAMGMTEGAVKVAVSRLRQRYRKLLHEEISQTLSDPSDTDEELRQLLDALQ